MAAAVVPAPPWWTAARHAGKIAAWFTALTIFTWSKWSYSDKSLGPEQTSRRAFNFADTAINIPTMSAGGGIGVLPKPK